MTGDTYGNYLKKQFFDPIGMTNTGVHSPRLNLTNEALGYERADNNYKRASNWNMDWAGGAGSLGVYKYKEGTNITITSKNSKLYGEATGDANYELVPLSGTMFLVKELNANLTFKKDASGKVSSIHVKIAGDERDAPKIE